MEARHTERPLLIAGGPPEAPSTEGADRRLEVTVLFTSVKHTAAALRGAATLLSGLRGKINLIDLQQIPYLLPLNKPPVALTFAKQRLLALTEESTVEITARVLLCRIRFDALLGALRPGSLIVFGRHRRWWPTWEKRLARKLERAGHRTILIESS